MGKYLNIKKMYNPVVSKPENHNLRRKAALKVEFEFSTVETRNIPSLLTLSYK